MKIYFLIILFWISALTTAQIIPLYVGTYTGANSEGIYCYDFNEKTGALSNKKLAIKADNPSFLTFSSNKKYLYAVTTTNNNGFVNAYAVTKTKNLQLLNKVSSIGKGPCHVQLNAINSLAAVSNYGGGSIAIYSIEKNGSLNEAFQVFDHNIASKKSHAHSAKFFKNDLFVADLGRDFLAQYELHKKMNYSLKENHFMKDGAGPRHFEISKKGAYIYVINELNSTITVLKKDKKSYKNIQNIGTLRADYTGKNSCADIRLSSNEMFLYGSNRGENSIVVFKRNKTDGTLKKIQNINVEGDWPRNFTLSPDGNYLLVANKISENISVFNINKTSGKLTFKHSITAPTPVCLLF